MKLAYELAMPQPETHLYHVTVRVSRARGGRLLFRMPAWAPGSYLIRDYARHVQDFEATDGAGKALRWTRVDKQTWEVETDGGKGIVVRYRVYANELSVQTSHLDATHAYGNGTSVLMYVEGAKGSPATLAIAPPKGWRVDIALPKRGGVWRAEDYDALVDAPWEIGTHRTLAFRVRGKRHRLAIYGRGNEDEDRLVADLTRIVEEEAEIFGGLPYEEYLFILHLADKPAGGLEHRGSNTSIVDRWTFQPGKKYEDFLALEAHEFFHTWNVKRLRPALLGPFDYAKEVHTTLLWAMEGITSYYDHLVLARAGLISEDRYREFLAETITKLRQQPGRFKLSLSQSSFLTWVKLYKQDSNWMNTGVSYYLKGELVGLVLDLAIRDRTDGKQGLDDVMRFLWETYPVDGPGIPELHAGGRDGWRIAIESVTGLSWRAFWSKYIDGTDEVDFEAFLEKVGWTLRAVAKDDDPQKKEATGEYLGPGAWLGAELKEHERRVKVQHVLVASPAIAAGLAPEDEIVAMDRMRANDKEWVEKRLRERLPGDLVTLHWFRRGELVEREIMLGENPPEKWTIEQVDKSTPRQKRLREDWLAPLAGAKRRKPVAGGKGRGRNAQRGAKRARPQAPRPPRRE
ncbi:MAG TPA: PDZ domain-containing protein [Candidatus Thermoplasmatota archaeon]|nr:PDZ domain-containing protein [Candidatus Thermoplasmatota archaeon]